MAFRRNDKVYDQEGKPAIVIDKNAWGYYDIDYGNGHHRGGQTDETLTPRTEPFPIDEVKSVVQTYIVTQSHNQDYISATCYLTTADSPHEAIINCRVYDDLGIDDEGEEDAELARLRSLSLYELEQDNRDSGEAWHAEVFKMPESLEAGDVVQIAKLDTD